MGEGSELGRGAGNGDVLRFVVLFECEYGWICEYFDSEVIVIEWTIEYDKWDENGEVGSC